MKKVISGMSVAMIAMALSAPIATANNGEDNSAAKSLNSWPAKICQAAGFEPQGQCVTFLRQLLNTSGND